MSVSLMRNFRTLLGIYLEDAKIRKLTATQIIVELMAYAKSGEVPPGKGDELPNWGKFDKAWEIISIFLGSEGLLPNFKVDELELVAKHQKAHRVNSATFRILGPIMSPN